MMLVDVNLLLNAYNGDLPDHGSSRRWWEDQVNGGQRLGLAWVTILGFVRIMTNPRAMQHPLSSEKAIAIVESWLDHPSIEVVEPGPRHAEILFGLLREAGVAGDLTTDAHLAALAIELQAPLASLDTDFARFPGLRWVNPASHRRR